MLTRRSLLASLALPLFAAEPHPAGPGITINPLLPPGPGNPRNTEGAFVTLKDGRILFAYSRFTSGGDDDSAAEIVGRYSNDGGRTWTSTDVPIVAREGGQNVMSVSFLRLHDGRIALFYARKNSVGDCRPYLRYSSDEARTWSDPILCTPDFSYFVLNNDRAVQLRGGRILLPVAQHTPVNGKFNLRGTVMLYFSDDAGRLWSRSRTVLECPTSSVSGFQEPGIVELKDGRLLMFIRTQMGSQYLSHSGDRGNTWSPAQPSEILSPLSPASIKRIPTTGDLLMVWNDHSQVDQAMRASETPGRSSGGRRTPLTVAVSRDEGRTWIHRHNVLSDPAGWYCYTAIHFAGSRVLLAFVAGGSGLPALRRTSLAWFDVKRLYRR
ncbi:MAG: sialidase family protein [Bryobacteraceae bacterium]